MTRCAHAGSNFQLKRRAWVWREMFFPSALTGSQAGHSQSALNSIRTYMPTYTRYTYTWMCVDCSLRDKKVFISSAFSPFILCCWYDIRFIEVCSAQKWEIRAYIRTLLHSQLSYRKHARWAVWFFLIRTVRLLPPVLIFARCQCQWGGGLNPTH